MCILSLIFPMLGWLVQSLQWLCYGMDHPGFNSQQGGNRFSVFLNCQAGSRAPSATPMGSRGFYLGLNLLTREGEYSRPSDTEVRKQWGCTSTPTHMPLRRAQ
jgi:hypothetical protein